MFGRATRGSLFSNDCIWNHHFFRDRDPRFLELLGRDVKVEVFKPGEIIMKEGTRGCSMYILRRGEVEILAGVTSVARLGSGSVFGEIVLLGVSDRRTATVRAVEFSDCRVVSRPSLLRLLRLFPREREYFQALANQRLAELSNFATDSQSPRRRNQALSPRAAAVLPQVVDSDDTANEMKNSALTDFSRFFLKPDWRTGMKRCRPQKSNISELVPLKELRPILPPLITRETIDSAEASPIVNQLPPSWKVLPTVVMQGTDKSEQALTKSTRGRWYMYNAALPSMTAASGGLALQMSQSTAYGETSSASSVQQSPFSARIGERSPVLE